MWIWTALAFGAAYGCYRLENVIDSLAPVRDLAEVRRLSFAYERRSLVASNLSGTPAKSRSRTPAPPPSGDQ